MTNEEHKIKLQFLKANLFDNFAIYHERVTLLIQLTLFEIKDTSVEFKAKIIKPLSNARAEESRLYKSMISKDEISFSASYKFGKDDNTDLIEGMKIGRPYCPFTLWLDPELTCFVAENKDDITQQIPKYILLGEDWKHLIQK